MILINSKTRKTIWFVISTFFIGWLASYLYDSLNIRNQYDNFFSFLAKVFGSIWDKAVFSAIHATSLPTWRLVLFSLAAIALVICVKDMIDLKKKDSNKKIISYIFNSLSIISFSFIGMSSLLGFLAYQPANITKNSIEIIKPYVDVNDYDLLKSEYYQIDTDKKYADFAKKLNDIAESENIKLP